MQFYRDVLGVVLSATESTLREKTNEQHNDICSDGLTAKDLKDLEQISLTESTIFAPTEEKRNFEWSPECAEDYKTRIHHLQADHGSLAALDYHYSFVKVSYSSYYCCFFKHFCLF